jgi:mRNA interferase HicA
MGGKEAISAALNSVGIRKCVRGVMHLQIVHKCTIYVTVNGNELVRKLKRLATQRRVEFSYEPRHGKGSHGQLLFGDKLTTVKDLKKEIGPGLLNDMLKQLGLTKQDVS